MVGCVSQHVHSNKLYFYNTCAGLQAPNNTVDIDKSCILKNNSPHPSKKLSCCHDIPLLLFKLTGASPSQLKDDCCFFFSRLPQHQVCQRVSVGLARKDDGFNRAGGFVELLNFDEPKKVTSRRGGDSHPGGIPGWLCKKAAG